ncbi:MAG: hypothetical protein KGJ60_00390 [Verrucomicrobiota bacterium]|nr:hypothetical protein [Verrucomicrobiota bacterium]
MNVFVALLTLRIPNGKLKQLPMADVSDPNLLVGQLGLVGLALGALWRLLMWVRQAPWTPDPWDANLERKLHEPDAVEVCHHCFDPRTTDGWFCEHCGSAVGSYNNLMPFVCLFSEGEVLRNGVEGKLRASPLVIAGYLLISLSAYTFFAPIYWIFFFRNLIRPKRPAEEIETASPG